MHPIPEGATLTTKDARAQKPDGRKRRWREHKVARREELVDGTLAAIRKLGATIGMDQIAAEIGVSKTVLYRYFTDKNDLTNAAMSRFVETILAPRLYQAIGEQLEEYDLVHSAITAYVETIASDTEIYLYVMSNGAGPHQDAVADSERMIAELVAVVVGQRARALGYDSGGATPWAYSIVGGIQLATHWWISNKSMTSDDLIDYLTMMIWGAIESIAKNRGSAAEFKSQKHVLPEPNHQV
ncbi:MULTISPECIES: TetR/AcrR family transcriptional regulator [Antrihabitans]|uniref:TetR/AcrR family transcriptional regulator n=2 Tax=Antrihabitans TaxID=2799491 RepID=A0A934NQZ6_9NOCA|nr:TetR/AcrR family transcriptional regulator [Antrihabitans stalagmiti]MBJ8339728.1 TetR/AcrR family transcriptional regulator [Antrihabitans stalagmiti]